MVKIWQAVIILIFILVLNSCSTQKPIASLPRSGEPAVEYIERYKDLAVSEMKRTGIPASITLAQGMIESDFGRSRLATEGNNHFGIKCHNDWTGPTIRHNDDKRNECFRKYRKPEESYYDHSDFLKSGSRYAFLFDNNTNDYKAWARGLKKAGYATNPDYANMLIAKIEAYQLWNYDTGKSIQKIQSQSQTVITDPVQEADSSKGKRPVAAGSTVAVVAARVPRIMENNRIKYLIVKDGESKESLEKEFQLLKWELAKYNELEQDFKPATGQLLYLQPKRDKAEPGKETHIAVAGETMYSISQIYGIKLKNLYEWNRMAAGSEPEPGKKLWLRGFKPVN
jgi:LysM repeat protein